MRARLAGLLCGALVLASASAARATDPVVHTLVHGMQVNADVFPNLQFRFEFPNRVAKATVAHGGDYTVTLEGKAVVVKPKKDAPLTSLHINTFAGHRVAVMLQPATSPDVRLLHLFVLQSVSSRQKPAPLPAQAAALTQMHNRFEISSAARGTFESGQYKLAVETTKFVHEGTLLKLKIRLSNLGERYPIAAIQVVNKHLVKYEGGHVEMSVSIPAILGTDRNMEGSVVIEQPDELGTEWQLRLLPSAQGIPPAVLQMVPMETARPEPSKRVHLGPLQGRVVITLRALGGAANLDDGPDGGIGTGRKAWALMSGFGAFASFGKYKRINVGGGIDLLRTDAVAIASEPGTVNSSALGGRVYAAGTIHGGNKVMPYARIGLGVAFANHRFEYAQSMESEFRMDGVFMFGGGLDWWPSRRYVVGLAVSSSIPFDSETGRAFEAGVRAGMAFSKAL